jgi:hypothetical protein
MLAIIIGGAAASESVGALEVLKRHTKTGDESIR